jgi:hypothetical protein
MMDYQVLFDIAVGIAAFFGGWTLNRIYTAIDRLDGDVREMPVKYVYKDDYRDDIKDMNRKLDKIFDLLQTKMDKE